MMSSPWANATLPSKSGAGSRPAARHTGQTGQSRAKCSRNMGNVARVRFVAQPSMMTVSAQGGRIFPVGAGSGATHAAKAIKSPARAAGLPPMSTVIEPWATMPGPPGTQEISIHGAVCEVTVAAGSDSISTVGTQFSTIGSGIGGCATGVGTGAGGWIGA